MKNFITAAENVLRLFGSPMNVADIVDYALESGVLKSNGKTPINTMRARLSEYIRKYKENSCFIRVSSNVFALREWGENEYLSPEFNKKINSEYVVTVKQSAFKSIPELFGFSREYEKYLGLLNNDNIVVLRRDKANGNYKVKQVVSYVLIKNANGQILSYIRGSYSSTKDKLLEGVLCIGFGGHVNERDYSDFFGLNDGGIRNAVYRELGEELRDIKIDEPELIGVINDDSSPLGLNHFAFVFVVQIKNCDIKKISAELSINKLKFLGIEDLNKRFSELEFWSQLLVKNLFDIDGVGKEIILKEKKRNFGFPFIVVGEIGSGKTEIAKIISRKLKVEYLSTRSVIVDVIEFSDFGFCQRTDFQDRALELIRSRNGCEVIASEIIKRIKGDKLFVIDGVRNIKTYNLIKAEYPAATLIYIDLPIDNSYHFFKIRSKREASIDEFRDARYHEVEKEVVLFKNRSDVYVYNGDSFEGLVKKISNWLDEKNSISN